MGKKLAEKLPDDQVYIVTYQWPEELRLWGRTFRLQSLPKLYETESLLGYAINDAQLIGLATDDSIPLATQFSTILHEVIEAGIQVYEIKNLKNHDNIVRLENMLFNFLTDNKEFIVKALEVVGKEERVRFKKEIDMNLDKFFDDTEEENE